MINLTITNIIYDLDGTLLNTYPGIEKSVKLAIKQFFPDFNIPDLHSMIGPHIRLVLHCLLGDIKLELLNNIELSFRDYYDQEGWQYSILYPGVLDALSVLQECGIQNFLVTNKPSKPTQKILDYFDLHRFFVQVLSPDVIFPCYQNKAEMIQYLINYRNLDPFTTIYVGDSKEDQKSAQDCHIQFLPAIYGYGKFDIVASEIGVNCLSKFSDLINLISTLPIKGNNV